jgi:hypothetical protein
MVKTRMWLFGGNEPSRTVLATWLSLSQKSTHKKHVSVLLRCAVPKDQSCNSLMIATDFRKVE